MARLFGIFARKVDAPHYLSEAEEDDAAGNSGLLERGARPDSTLFGDLGEKTGDIKAIFSDIDGRLHHVETLASDISELRQKFSHFLRLYRDLALLNVSLGREKERLSGELQGSTDQATRAQQEAHALRQLCDDSAVKLEKAQASLEAYEQNVQLLGVAKRELETKLQEAHSALSALGDEESVLRRECDAFKARIFADEHRIRDLSEKYQSSFEQATSLRERCQLLEGELRAKGESFASVREENVRLAHEVDRLGKENVNLEKLISETRTELSAIFDRYQKEVRAKDEELGDLKNELKTVRSDEQTFQKINGDLKNENERLARELREVQEAHRQTELQVSRGEARVTRLVGEMEATKAARNQLDQARLAMVSRVEALTQAVRSGEVDIRRLEGEIAALGQANQDLKAGHATTIEQLNLRIHELEGQLEHQKNENAYLTSKRAREDDF
jgi:chromosome segregation protein